MLIMSMSHVANSPAPGLTSKAIKTSFHLSSVFLFIIAQSLSGLQ